MKNNRQDEIRPGQIAAVTLFSILLALVLLWFATLEIKVESSKQAKAKSTPVAHKQPASTKKLRRKGKTKMVQIARGTTGQAELVSEDCTVEPFGPDGVSIDGISIDNPSMIGWEATPEGVVTVPLTAPFGVYELLNSIPDGCEIENEPGVSHTANHSYRYQFEVVCMKVTITASKQPPTP